MFGELIVGFFCCVLFGVCGFTEILPPTEARKCVHMLSGVIFLLAPATTNVKVFMCCWAALIVAQVWFTPPLRYAQPRDKGITTFGFVVWACTLLGVPYRVLGPMFFADPLAAIVGSRVRSPKLVGQKTVVGFATAWVAALLALPRVDGTTHQRVAFAAIIAFAELVGGKLDNLMISLVLLLMYFTKCFVL